MDGARHGAELEQLLAEIGWVQRLARGLVRDPAGAEDLAQDALVRSLDQRAHAPSSPGALRAWLATLVRRLAIDRGRAERSRASREVSRADVGDGAHAEPIAIVVRSERQQELVSAVHALSDPYRTTILLRYLDELGPREIAARMQVDEALVRKRLSRGLAQLHERLARSHGDVDGWLAALWLAHKPAELVPGGQAGTGAAIGGGSLSSTALLGAAALLALAALGWRFVRAPADTALPLASVGTPRVLEAHDAEAPQAVASETAQLAASGDKVVRASAATPSAASAVPAPEFVRATGVKGRVLVDGVARLPRGFEIEGWSQADLHTDPAPASYTYGPRPPWRPRNEPDPSKLKVTSAETVAFTLSVPSDAELFTADLELTTGRTLDLVVVRAPDEAPCAEFELALAIDVTTQHGIRSMQVSRDSRRVRTDADGRALITGVPRNCVLRLSRCDAPATPTRTGRVVWSHSLDETSLSRVEARVVVAADAAGFALRGSVPASDCAPVRVHARPSGPPLAASSEPEGATFYATRRFELRVEPRTTWDVWAECDHERITEIARVVVGDGDAEPVELTPRMRRDVVLEVVRIPGGARAQFIVTGERPTRNRPLTVVDGSARATISLDGPSSIQVDASTDDRMRTPLRTVTVDADPARSAIVRVDLGGDVAREVELLLAGPSVRGPIEIRFRRHTAAGAPRETSVCNLVDGRSERPCLLPAGRWTWLTRGGFDGFAVGIVEVGAAAEPVKLFARLSAHPRAELGAGVEVLDVDGVAPPPFVAGKPIALRWDSLLETRDAAELWLPANLRYRVLERR